MEKDAFPLPRIEDRRRPVRRWTSLFKLVVICLLGWVSLSALAGLRQINTSNAHALSQATLDKCAALHTKPGPLPSFGDREQNDRFVPGTKSVLLKNATIWTGRDKGLHVTNGDVLLSNGLIKAVGVVDGSVLHALDDYEVVDVQGAWVSPGIVDLHSHMGVAASPALDGANDGNSLKGLTLPWLRSVDGLNTHDDSFRLAVAGGVTTSLILPGSADAIGGQAFVIKTRPTKEKSTSSMLLEPPFGLNGSDFDRSLPPRWRHMKHACGENPAGVYSGTRMDSVWATRQVYDKARQIKRAQDEYCSAALSGQWKGLGAFPEELQWEAAVDILRGKVKVQTHCYEAVDIDDFVRLSSEFEFPIAAFHHAHEAYLVPEVLKRAYGHPPAIAMFAAFSRYKRESYRHSEFAPRILADNGISVVMKSDHPGIVSRYLVHEAQQAHYYGLEENVALSSIISTPAEVLGLDHRVGFIREGFDADIVVWDSHPLALGATPTQVFIDGIAQLEASFVSQKPASKQKAPITPNFDAEAEKATVYDGLPPLEPTQAVHGLVVFRNVSKIWSKDGQHVKETFNSPDRAGIVVVDKGKIIYSGSWYGAPAVDSKAVVVDLKGGSLSPGLVSYGSQLGTMEISMEPSTTDGTVRDPLTQKPSALLAPGTLVRAVDGLQFDTRDALHAYRAGITSAITPPQSEGLVAGLSVAFSTGAAHKLAPGAVLHNIAALHFTVSHGISASISTQIAALRRILLGEVGGEIEEWAKKVTDGILPIVLRVDSADIIATLIQLKQEVEAAKGHAIKFTLVGGAEAHLLAKEIASANIGVILTPPRSFPYTWEQKRIHPGPPLSKDSVVSLLASQNVTVGLGPQGVNGDASMSQWAVRNLRFDAGWVALESNGLLTKEDVLAMASSNIEQLLGVEGHGDDGDIVATMSGDLLSFEGKVVAVVSSRRGAVDII
ncbi:hypothetical protein PLICRDRAFT_172382 [Plicaturopsis crispa FD-325 SS-3]|nr:hypothetical protein PLICRDRAFT_172382 [Plicaturopsis crispa FD-325 SS-3]